MKIRTQTFARVPSVYEKQTPYSKSLSKVTYMHQHFSNWVGIYCLNVCPGAPVFSVS